MRRDNLLQHVREGGLELSHFFVKQLVSRFFFLRAITCILIRAFMQVKLSSYFSFFLVSDCDGEPTRLVGFQKKGVDAVLFFFSFAVPFIKYLSV